MNRRWAASRHGSQAPCVDGSGLARGFDFLQGAGRSCHVSGLWIRRRNTPLAKMLSADQVPVNSPRSKRLALSGCPSPWADWRKRVTSLLLLPMRFTQLPTRSRWSPVARRRSSTLHPASAGRSLPFAAPCSFSSPSMLTCLSRMERPQEPETRRGKAGNYRLSQAVAKRRRDGGNLRLLRVRFW